MLDMARSVGPWEPIYYLERGWHELQDVYAFRRGPDAQHPESFASAAHPGERTG
jgi:hypothetical protein